MKIHTVHTCVSMSAIWYVGININCMTTKGDMERLIKNNNKILKEK